MKGMLIRFVFFLLLISSAHANDAGAILALAEQHARQIALGQAGTVDVEAGPLDTSRLAPCQRIEAYSPPNIRSMGRTQVGIRCLGPGNWNILVPVRISVQGNYLTSARALAAGQTIQESDLHLMTGDLAGLPNGALNEISQATGLIMRNSIAAGQVLRRDQLVAPLVIRQGQTVKVIASGTGFAVSAEGRAINNAAEGEIVQVRMQNGTSIRGIARSDGRVELSN